MRGPSGCENARDAARATAPGHRTPLRVTLALRDADELCVCDPAWITARAEHLAGRAHLARPAGLWPESSWDTRKLRELNLATRSPSGPAFLLELTQACSTSTWPPRATRRSSRVT